MKKLSLLLVSIFFTIVSVGQQWTKNLPQDKLQNGTLNFYEIQKSFNDYWEQYNVGKDGYYYLGGEKVKATGWKQFRRWEYYWENRIVKETGQFPATSASEELEKYLIEDPGGKSASGNWTNLGPSATSGGYAGLGRINCAGFVLGDNNTIYVGSPSGGIWKTSSGGTSWTPIGDNNAVIGVSDIVAYRPASLPDVIYIATGDKDGGSMWSLGGGQYNDNNSVGVLKSTDGGITWNTTGLSFTAGQIRTVNRLLLHPSDNNILYTATSVGVYKTTNGGTNWTLISSNVFIDMEFKPGTPATIYGSNLSGDIYRSINDGSTWTLTLSTSNSRTELAVSANNSSVVYAVVSNSSSGLAGIYKSTDSGASFSQVFSGATTNLLNWDCNSTSSGGQAWYDLCIAADPTNANNVFVGGVNTWRSTNGGTSWSISNHWTGSCSVTEVHADKHYLGYQNGTSTLFEGNDGGFYKTTNNGSSWTHIGSGLITSQIYRLGVAQTVANENIIGLQDNGTKAFLSGTWSDELGGDGFECAFNYTNANIIYGELYYGDISRSTNHGSSWSSISSGLSGSAHWCTPFVIDPSVNTTLYIGYQDVFKSTNQGTSWSQISSWGGSTLKSLAVAPSNSNYIYAATSSILYKTTNGGTSWSNITGTIPVGSGDITYISVKSSDPNTVWVSLGGYNATRVYQTTNGGTSWTNISTGLPSVPVMCVIQNKQNTAQDELYAGTDAGVYVKNGSANWTMFSTGLPKVVVTELEIYYNANAGNSRIRAATYGRGLWQSDLLSSSVAPVAAFTASTTTPNLGQTVTFTDQSTNTPTSWAWSFSPTTVTYVGGTTSASQNPQLQFNAAGYYTVTLMATNAAGSDGETKTNYILASATPPVANFSASTTTPNVGQTVTFTDLSTNTPTSWAWSFSPSTVTYVGGTTSASQNPQVQFNAAGYYTVTLTATNSAGSDGETKTNYILASVAPPVANFSASSTTPLVGQTVTFTDLSTNLPTSWAWSFSPSTVTYMGGTTSTSQNPQVKFNAAGYYTVTLTATNAGGSDGETKTNYILASVPPPVANFSASTTTPIVGQTVTFTDLSTNTPTSWAWSFSPSTVTYLGGTNATSQHPQVQFIAAGYYTVTLTATNSGGSDGETKTNYINALDNPPVATLKLGTLTNPAPGTVLVPVTLEAINNPAAGNNLINSWNWFIAYDASRLYNGEPMGPVNLTNYHPLFPYINYMTNILEDYPSPGWNTLALVYTSDVSATGSVGMKFFDIVFNYDPGSTVCPNLFWTSTEITGSSLYDDGGNEFIMTLINGCVWSEPPVTDFMANSTNPFVGQAVDFMDLSTNYPTSWLWSFNPPSVTYVNGTSSTSQNPQVQFNNTGLYTATLIASNALGADTETKLNYLTVKSPFIYLDLTVFLQGTFNGTAMTPYLNGILPFTQPYNTTPWNYTGTESVASIPNANVVDWVLIELRDATNVASATSATMIDQKAAFLLNNGKVVGLDGTSTLQFSNSLTQQLYVVVWHRNHLGVMTSTSVTESGGIYTYNFSTGAGQAYGGTSAHKQIGPGVWGMIGGDGNKDGQITASDESLIWESQAGTKGYLESDYNLNTQTDNKDKNDIWAPNQGAGSQVLD